MNYNKYVSQNEYWWIAIGLSILFIITPMFYSTGIIILIFSITSILVVGFRTNKEIRLEILLIISLIVMLSITENAFSGNERWKLPLVSSCMLIAFRQIQLNREAKTVNKLSISVKVIVNLLFYTIWIWGMYEIIRFIVVSLGNWEQRRVLYLYPFDMHYVDFTFMLIFIFNFGVKTKHFFTTLVFTLISIAVFPARMYTFYIVFFCLIYFFHKKIKKYLKLIQLNNYFVLILIFAISVTILAILWTLILTNIFKVNATHQGYFDDSNQMRFMTVVYALQVISKYRPVFTGFPSISWLQYSELIQSPFATNNGPHNSYILMILYYGIVFSLIYWYMMSRIFNKASSRINDSIIISYLLCAGILHLTLEGYRLFFILSILMIPDDFGFIIHRPKKIRYIFRYRVRKNDERGITTI